MLELKRFDLQSPREWERFAALFSAYLTEVCDEDEYRENLADLQNEALNRQLIGQTLRKRNPYRVSQIVLDGECIGLISYSFHEEQHRGFLNNFYICPEYRNAGVGSAVYRMTEAELKAQGAVLIELAPVEKALPFYARHGFTPCRKNADGEMIYQKRIG